ncbi:MAG: hypothetical protein LC808_04720 [Actinobacteria bacterium]|nr:hypothetical protein [Actinomycetota bacterium]
MDPDSPVTSGCRLPELAEEPVEWGLVHGALIFWFPIATQPDLSLGIKFIALSILAAEEYLQARKVLATVQSDNNRFFGRYNSALAHVETAILALDRAMRIADQLNRRGTLPGPTWTSMPSRRARTRISKLRNRIEHADKEIPAGKWPDSASSFLYGSRDKFEVADAAATWEELGRWVDQAQGSSGLMKDGVMLRSLARRRGRGRWGGDLATRSPRNDSSYD